MQYAGHLLRTKLCHPTASVWKSQVQTACILRTFVTTFPFKNRLLPSLSHLRTAQYSVSSLSGSLWRAQKNVLRTPVLCRKCSGEYSKTEIIRDVLLYKNDKGMFFKALGAFAVTQLVFWTYLTRTAYLTMKDTNTYIAVKYGEEGPPPDVANWTSWAGIKNKLSSGKWRYGIVMLSVGAGSTIFVFSCLYSRKSIYRIILRKGGEDVTFQTYGLFGFPWRFTTSINNVSCEHARHGVRTQLPIKVRGHRMFYILDKDGKFYNARLFDYSVGMHRML